MFDAAVAEPPLVTLRRNLDLRLSEMRLDRSQVEPDWHELTRFLLPERGRYLAANTARRPRASSRAIVDPTATKAHQRLAAFCMAGITNPALPWFKLGIAEDDVADDDDVRAYLSECEKRMQRVLAAGTFYNALHQLYEELAGFGTGAIIAVHDFEDVLRFYPLTVGEYFVALNDRQELDELFREYSLTVKQLVEQFGYDKCSITVRNLYDSKRYSGPVIVCHAIQPNRQREPGRLGWQGAPYIGTYFERSDTSQVLKVEGFAYRPFVAPRWHALAGDPYGTGPGHKALPDIKSLQAGVRQMREAGEKLVNPPLQGDARYQNSYQGLLPGDVNWIAGLDTHKEGGLRPIFAVPPNITALAQEVESYRGAIKETFYNDMILAISQMEGVQPRNEMEIMERRNEKMLMLGPVLERFYTEALSPLVRIAFARMQAVGIMPRAPAKLHGRQIEPKFVSVLAQAQKSVGTTGMEQLIRMVGSMAGVWAGASQNIDPDVFVHEYAHFLDVPAKIIVPRAQVEQARAQLERQQQMAQAADLGQKLAQGAQTLSQADVGGGQNALAAMLGRQGGAPS